MKGLANIPLILGIILLVLAVPVAVLLVQQNQNTQNRAYEVTAVGSVDCTQVLNAKITYCTGSTVSNQSGVPCSAIDSAIAQYCTNVIPTSSTCKPRPPCLDSRPACKMPEPIGGWCKTQPTPTSSIRCTTGQTKCAGRILLKCTNNQWNLLQTCPFSCINGACGAKPPIIKPPIIIQPPTNPVY